jgi:hypothetical protein
VKKRVAGYFFIFLAVVLTLGVTGQLSSLLRIVFGSFKLLTGDVDAFETGYLLGSIGIWTLYFFITILLWKYGMEWVKRI